MLSPGSLEEIATLLLPPGPHQTLSFSNDGSELLLGTYDYQRRAGASGVINTPALGVMWVNWAAQGEAPIVRVIPPERFIPNVDSRVYPIGVDVEVALAIAGSRSAYEGNDEQVWLLNKDERIPARLVHQVRNSPLTHSLSWDRTHLLLLGAQSDRPELEIIPLVPFGPVRRVPLARGGSVQAIALNASRTHVAIAYQDLVACAALDGEEVCRWPNATRVEQLSFAEDDLALWGMRSDAVTLFQWKGEPVDIAVPGMRPRAIDAEARTALFFRGHREFCELDLSSRVRRSSGHLSDHPHSAWHLKRRRYATLDDSSEGPRLRVFRLTD